MIASGYEEIDHTADIALRVWGEDFYALLSQSAKGMYDLMGINPEAESHIENTFQIESGVKDTVLVDFLNEVLFLAEDRGQVYQSFSFNQIDAMLEVNVSGQKVESIRRNIKAVTFHDLDIVETDQGLETTITFDV